MAKIWRTTLAKLVEDLDAIRDEHGDDVPASVHGYDCVDVRLDGHGVSLVGFHAHSKSEMNRMTVQRET